MDPFSRRQEGVNPIALELDRLAEQRALQTLGRGRPQAPALAVPAPSGGTADVREVGRPDPTPLSPSPLASGHDLGEAYAQMGEGYDISPEDYASLSPEEQRVYVQSLTEMQQGRDAFVRALMATR